MKGGPSAPGTLIASLDFELYWGVRDVKTVAQYRENLLGVRRAIPALLAFFADYGIHATWATVGFLFFASRVELLAGAPIVAEVRRCAPVALSRSGTHPGAR